MKALRFIVPLLVALLFGILFFLFRATGSGVTMAPDFARPDLRGQLVRLADLRGQVVVLNLWATWCLPCVKEMPTLEALHRNLSDEGVVVVAVSQDEDPDKVGSWIAERGFTLPVLLDPGAEVGHDLGVSGYPETFVIDRDGRIVHHHIGYRDWATPDIQQALRRLLASGDWVFSSLKGLRAEPERVAATMSHAKLGRRDSFNGLSYLDEDSPVFVGLMDRKNRISFGFGCPREVA